ncbi:MAG: hypothetical protein R3325_01495 [Thermoanaerobaculia bacterium]|nr:hypothetical protein [Thermoanaerobaculia bacterium]
MPKRFLTWFVLPTAALLTARVAPLVSGLRTLVLRDVLHVHYPMKWTQAQAFLDGRLPLVDPARFGGQALLGNPNATVLYPDSLLLLLAPPLWVLNARFWIHLLVAPAAAWWLGRAWGLGRRASWAVAVTYAASGFFLSNLNLHNLVAGAALTPALVAASLRLGETSRRGPLLAAAALLWSLLLLAGDPMTAAVALLLAATAPLVRWGWRRGRGWLARGVAFALGTGVATPQIVEFLRILPQSYRGYWRFSEEAATVASFNPVTAFEWLVPMAFGRPDLTFWGARYFAGESPLYFSLAPGALALALVLVAGRPRSRAALWGWGAVLLGLFVALGRYNPVVAGLMPTVGGGLLRFPIKVWPLVAVGGALLCGLGFERLLGGRGRRAAGVALGLLALFYAGLWTVLQLDPGAALLGRVLPPGASAGLTEQVRLQWSGVSLISLAVLALLALLLARASRSSAAAGLALAVHLGAQLLLLAPLLPTDDAAFYRAPPPAAQWLPDGAVVVQGDAEELFGPPETPRFPDPRVLWLTRQTWGRLEPWAAIRWGKRAELDLSPEGLDTFVARATAQAMERLPDPERVRLLRAVGVEYLLLGRELSPPAAAEVEELGTVPVGLGRSQRLYRIADGAREVWLAPEVVWAEHLNAALARLTAAGFDPAATAVLAGRGEPSAAAAGEVEVIRDGPERLEATVRSPGGGALVTRRAFLPIYRARIDGRPARPLVANLYRLALPVPPGEHRVELAVDRRPLAASLTASALALLALALVARRRGAPV